MEAGQDLIVLGGVVLVVRPVGGCNSQEIDSSVVERVQSLAEAYSCPLKSSLARPTVSKSLKLMVTTYCVKKKKLKKKKQTNITRQF